MHIKIHHFDQQNPHRNLQWQLLKLQHALIKPQASWESLRMIDIEAIGQLLSAICCDSRLDTATFETTGNPVALPEALIP